MELLAVALGVIGIWLYIGNVTRLGGNAWLQGWLLRILSFGTAFLQPGSAYSTD